MKTWDKRGAETTKSYAAFIIYRDLGAKRSLQKAADQHYGKSGANVRQFERWSVQHDWVARVAAYDIEQRLAYERTVAERFAADRAAEREKRQDIVKALRGMLGKVMEAQYRLEMSPSDLKALSHAAKMILEQSRAEFNDLPTQRNEITGADGGELVIRVEYEDPLHADGDD